VGTRRGKQVLDGRRGEEVQRNERGREKGMGMNTE
jgi:hypothetical protein